VTGVRSSISIASLTRNRVTATVFTLLGGHGNKVNTVAVPLFRPPISQGICLADEAPQSVCPGRRLASLIDIEPKNPSDTRSRFHNARFRVSALGAGSRGFKATNARRECHGNPQGRNCSLGWADQLHFPTDPRGPPADQRVSLLSVPAFSLRRAASDSLGTEDAKLGSNLRHRLKSLSASRARPCANCIRPRFR